MKREGLNDLSGTPWGREAFSNNVEAYIKTKYPNIELKKQEVSYSFKEMKYYSAITTDSGLIFRISTDYDNKLIDNYYVAMWESAVGKSVSFYINNKIDPSISTRLL